jgi:hypothetical protein
MVIQTWWCKLSQEKDNIIKKRNINSMLVKLQRQCVQPLTFLHMNCQSLRDFLQL